MGDREYPEGRVWKPTEPATFEGTRRFQVIRRLGSGGMGDVYEALDRHNGSRVALKLLSALSPEALLRFKNEFRVLQDIRHRNLVCLHELHEEDGLWFLTMEVVDGVEFLQHVRPAAPLTTAASKDTTKPSRQARPLRAQAADATPPDVASSSIEFDEARLRDALGQLALGLRALHAAGKVHRDVKPSNVLVTREGRVVLLDFGLAINIDHSSWVTGDQRVIGTPAFMAPEQAAADRAGPESDWYAVGGMLYVALTGRLPFDGRARDILYAKQHAEPPAPSAIVTTVPADLDALCSDLLRLHPAARPTDDEVIARLRVDAAVDHATDAESQAAIETPFVGREREIALLAQAFDEARSHHAPIVVLVRGESGVGKSALARRFTARMAVEHGAVVLGGRCYESETVPFKAVDGIVDALTAYMAGLSAEDAAALLPLRASLLAQVFPVLRRVPAIARTPPARQEGLDPPEVRTRAFAALRELLVRLAERRPLVLAIDDLQWTDADSLVLLKDVLRSPDAPALLLVATVRDLPGGPDLSTLADDVRDLRLDPLPPEDARELATLLVQSYRGKRRIDPATIAAEGRGHPLFIDELVRHGGATDGRPSSPAFHLEDVLWARIETLGAPASHILELLAVAGAPMPQASISLAAAMERAELVRHLAHLRAARLVHVTGVRGTDTIQCCHDRVRAAVIAHLAPEALRRCHGALAVALEAADRADADALALHWSGAGDRERAASYAAKAAAQAASALAFDRSAQLYRWALELHAPADPEARHLHVALGEVLIAAGRGLEAAEAFIAAIPGAQAAEVVDLRRRAAEQFLFSGHVDRGLAALADVLPAIGMRLPATPFRSLVSLLVSRARLRLRGLGFRERDSSQVAADELTRVDLCWSIAISLCMIDHIRGADFQTRATLLALAAGEPFRITRALTTEMAYAAIDGRDGIRRSTFLHRRAEVLVRRIDQPYINALFYGAAGVAAFLQGRWKDARDLCEETAKTLFGRIAGAAWEFDTMELYGALARVMLGEYDEVRRLLPVKLAEAATRGDLYAATSLRTGPAPFIWLADDTPEMIRQQVPAAMAAWSQHGFHVQHFLAMYNLAQADLYDGRGAAALQRVDDAWPLMSSAQLLRVQVVRALADDIRGRAALADASANEAGRDQLVKIASRSVRRLRRERLPWTDALASMRLAGIAAVRGDADAAARLYASAEEQCLATGMGMQAAAARRRRGELLRDEALVARADEWMTRQGVVRPDRVTAWLAPGGRAPTQLPQTVASTETR